MVVAMLLVISVFVAAILSYIVFLASVYWLSKKPTAIESDSED